MPRPANYSTSLLARVRRHYGLLQADLAGLLGVSPELVKHIEAGRRALTREVAERLAPFLLLLPTTESLVAPEATLPPPGPFDPGPLEARRAACLHEARNLRWRLRDLPAQAQQAANWMAALPGILAALPPPPPEGTAPTTHEAARLRYVHSWLATVPLALSPEMLAQWHLGHQRARALEAEAAALGALLGS